MKFRTILAIVTLGLIPAAAASVGRRRTADVAFTYRMGAGFPGDVNRTHPADIIAGKVDEDLPPLSYGIPVIVDATSHDLRQLTTTEQSDATPMKCYGFAVRPYPQQQRTGGDSSAFGAAVPPADLPLDVLRSGYIMAKLNSGVAVKDAPVYIWTSASTGNHVQGGVEGAADAGDTVELSNATFNGPADADGIVEISVAKLT